MAEHAITDTCEPSPSGHPAACPDFRTCGEATEAVAQCSPCAGALGVRGALAGAPGHDEDNPDAGPGDVVTVERIAEAP